MMTNNQTSDIQELNRELGKDIIHYNQDRVIYTIEEYEIDLIKNYGNSIWKDVFIAGFAIGIPTLINGLTNLSPSESEGIAIPIEAIMNLMAGGVSFIVGIICLIVWIRSKQSLKKILIEIKTKPQYFIPNRRHITPPTPEDFV